MTGIRYAIGTRLAAMVESSGSRTALIRLTDKNDNSRGTTSARQARYEGSSSSNCKPCLLPIPTGLAWESANLRAMGK
jgi:hypothetical protein